MFGPAFRKHLVINKQTKGNMIERKNKPRFTIQDQEFDTLEEAQAFALAALIDKVPVQDVPTRLVAQRTIVLAIPKSTGRKPRVTKVKTVKPKVPKPKDRSMLSAKPNFASTVAQPVAPA